MLFHCELLSVWLVYLRSYGLDVIYIPFTLTRFGWTSGRRLPLSHQSASSQRLLSLLASPFTLKRAKCDLAAFTLVTQAMVLLLALVVTGRQVRVTTLDVIYIPRLH